MESPDPRAPLVIDTHELSRRPGSQRDLTLTVPAPAELGIEMLTVPEGDEIDLDLRLEAVMEGVLVTAEVVAPLSGECVRCLEPIEEETEVRFQELYMYDDSRSAETIEESEDISLTDGDLIDLEPALRNALLLELPLQPLCEPDCLGLCVECGFRINEDPNHTHEAPIDPRWASLAATVDPASTRTTAE